MFSLLAQTLRHVPCIHVQKMPQIVSVKAEVTSFDTGFFFLPAWKYLSSTGLVWAEHSEVPCMWRCGEACQAVRVHPVKAVRNAWLYRLQGLSEESQVTTPSPHVEHLQVTFGGAPHSKGAGGKRLSYMFQGNIGKLKGLVLAQNSQVNFPWPIEVPVNHKYDRTGRISRTHVVVAQSPTIASVNRAGEQQSLCMRLQQPFV